MALYLLGSQNMGAISTERKFDLLASANQLLGESLAEVENLKVAVL
jgi:hypothetical protein